MKMEFKRHYTIQEARALLPSVRKWLGELEQLRDKLARLEKRLESLAASGHDLGGSLVNESVRTLAAMKVVLNEFEAREIQIKDLDRGLVDFPSLRDGREIFLCWEKDEEDIEFWHELHTGFSGREPV